jgi:hypothetical protein
MEPHLQRRRTRCSSCTLPQISTKRNKRTRNAESQLHIGLTQFHANKGETLMDRALLNRQQQEPQHRNLGLLRRRIPVLALNLKFERCHINHITCYAQITCHAIQKFRSSRPHTCRIVTHLLSMSWLLVLAKRLRRGAQNRKSQSSLGLSQSRPLAIECIKDCIVTVAIRK